MFTLWYTVLSYKQYRNTLWDKLCSKKGGKETAVVCPLPPKKPAEPSRIPIVEPPRTPSPQIPVTPPPANKPQQPILNKPRSEKIDPPPKPPRSPSPHPIRSEAFDDIEYDDEEETTEESEPEEENSVLATPQKKPTARTVNDFIDKEKAT